MLLGLHQIAGAYEVTTHARITDAAFVKSRLGASAEIIQRLGIDVFVWKTSATPFVTSLGNTYFDINRATGATATRYVLDFDTKKMPRIAGGRMNPDTLRLNGWLMRGAIREDDAGDTIVRLWKGEPLGDQPFGVINRFCNHFFDPVSDPRPSVGRGLSGGCLGDPIIQDAVQWALGSQSPFQSSPLEDTARRNHFSVLDAREAMWRALTLKNADGSAVPQFGNTPTELRKMYWATTFRTLGDVLHTIQDMGQPQHTRNEGHGRRPGNDYESYIDARALREQKFVIDGVTLALSSGQLPDLEFGDHPIPRFNRYSDYWSTRERLGSLYGLADYSNRGFFTDDSNVGNNSYLEPSSVGLTVAREPFDSFAGFNFSYVYGVVEDKLTGANDRISMSTQGVFAGLIQGGAGPFVNAPLYTFRRKNFDDRASLLIPRAVSYSAGILDYFFRGKLAVGLPDEGVYGVVDHSVEKSVTASPAQGFRKIKLKVSNITENIGDARQDMVNGTLLAIVRFHRNTCYTEDLSGEWKSPDMVSSKGVAVFDPPAPLGSGCRSAEEEIVVSAAKPGFSLPAITLPLTGPDQPVEFLFSDPIPINATDVYLQVVFRGKLGAEDDAVVVETKDIGEPSFISYSNNLDYVFCYNGQWYLRGTNGEFPASLAGAIPNGDIQYPPVPLTNVQIAFEPYDEFPSAAPLLQVAELPLKSYIRFATLGELNSNWGIAVTIMGNIYSTRHQLRETNPRELANQIYYSSSGAPEPRAREVFKFRNVYSAGGLFYHWGQGAACNSLIPPASTPAHTPVLTSVAISSNW